MADKPSTEDILNKIRQQSAGGESAEKPVNGAPAPAEVSEAPAAEEAAAPAKPVAKAAPKGTTDILASIRGGGGAAAKSAAS